MYLVRTRIHASHGNGSARSKESVVMRDKQILCQEIPPQHTYNITTCSHILTQPSSLCGAELE